MWLNRGNLGPRRLQEGEAKEVKQESEWVVREWKGGRGGSRPVALVKAAGPPGGPPGPFPDVLVGMARCADIQSSGYTCSQVQGGL